MCSMEKIASCQISFTPIESKNYIAEVDKVLEIIKSYDMTYRVELLSTTIRGPKTKILELIHDIYNTMDPQCKFSLDIKISNICGCD